jgi:serine/threonine protein kinase
VSTRPGSHQLKLDDASQVWDLLSERVEAWVESWETCANTHGEPPTLADFLPAEPPVLRRLTLVELIKVDLEYRWRDGQQRRLLEWYVEQFPDLRQGSGIPCDLIYEEYHIRHQAGDAVDPDEFCARFPAQATELRRLLGIEKEHLSTALFTGDSLEQIEVGKSLDDFDLLTRLGRGAFAVVFLARQRSMQRLVALKVSADRGHESQTMAQLDHPHIVRVFDQRVLPERRLRLMYMQYISGGTLQNVADLVRRTPLAERRGKLLLDVVDEALLSRGESPPTDSRIRKRLAEASWPEVVCWIGARLASALNYAHQRGVLHRDVKPANVLVSSEGNPKLADFNISFSSKVEGATAAAYFGGSLAYMSPEQLDACNPANDRGAETLDGRSDVFSVGVLLWELLTGERPFRDRDLTGDWSHTLEEMAQTRKRGVEPAVIAKLPPKCPEGLQEVLLKSLTADVDERYATAAELSKQLTICLQPQVQRLYRLRPGDWRILARRLPLLFVLIFGLVPNVFTSVLSITYNLIMIIMHAENPLVREIFWKAQLGIVNTIAYTLGITVLLRLAWPVLTAVAKLHRGEEVDRKQLSGWCDRCLKMGEYVAWVTAALWTISGFIFPLWINLELGTSGLSSEHWFHFVLSQTICGLLSSTLSFFFVTFLMTRVNFPLLVQSVEPDSMNTLRLQALGRRIFVFLLMSPVVPLLACFFIPSLTTNNESKWSLIVLGSVGIGSFVLEWLLFRLIQTDVAALTLSVSPEGATLGGSEVTESFLTGSR